MRASEASKKQEGKRLAHLSRDAGRSEQVVALREQRGVQRLRAALRQQHAQHLVRLHVHRASASRTHVIQSTCWACKKLYSHCTGTPSRRSCRKLTREELTNGWPCVVEEPRAGDTPS